MLFSDYIEEPDSIIKASRIQSRILSKAIKRNEPQEVKPLDIKSFLDDFKEWKANQILINSLFIDIGTARTDKKFTSLITRLNENIDLVRSNNFFNLPAQQFKTFSDLLMKFNRVLFSEVGKNLLFHEDRFDDHSNLVEVRDLLIQYLDLLNINNNKLIDFKLFKKSQEKYRKEAAENYERIQQLRDEALQEQALQEQASQDDDNSSEPYEDSDTSSVSDLSGAGKLMNYERFNMKYLL